MNWGLRHAQGEVICFIDDDAVPHPDWLERLLAPYADPTVGGVGGRDFVYHGEELSAGSGRSVGRFTWYGRVIGNHHLDFPPGLREVDHLKGVNMSFRRSLMPPRFDPRLSGGAAILNDTDLSLTVKATGHRLLFDPEACVDHYPGERFGESSRNLVSTGMLLSDSHNWAYLVAKHSSGPRRLASLGYALLVGSGERLGLLKLCARLPRGPLWAVRQWLTTMRGLRAGLSTWRRQRLGRGGDSRPEE
jgi:GT2 family glycosyltransferase